jgi:hypothetical protein
MLYKKAVSMSKRAKTNRKHLIIDENAFGELALGEIPYTYILLF